MNDCVFCRIVARQLPSQIVYEDERAVAFKDLNPQAPVHVLIVPKRHVSGLGSCVGEDGGLLGHIQLVAAKLAVDNGISEGYRLLTNNGRGAGQTVDHLHYHLLGGRSLKWPPG
jgi:histidine triad (HIT) family protein